jgi:hypothetical protein
LFIEKDKMELKEIDYKKLKKKIVEQAYVSAYTLSDEQTRKLIQDKFERARALYEAQKKSPVYED